MKKTLPALLGLTAVLTGMTLAAPAILAAAPTPPAGAGQALEIAPPIENISGNPGQTIKLTIKLRDISKSSLVVTGEVNDFVAAGEDGTPKILLKNNDNENPYSLRKWVSPPPTFTMSPGHIQNLPISIVIPRDASPGGHYGVIRFTGTPPNVKGSGVALSASLGTLILLTVNGPVKEQLAITQFAAAHGGSTGSLFESAPIDFIEKVKNSGNIHESPTGHIIVKNMFGKTVAGLNINLPPHNILPASTRKFTQHLDKTVIGDKKLFGRYTADLKMTYGSGSHKKTLTSSVSFWVLPYRLIALIIIILVGGFFLLRHLIRRYNRRIINKAHNPKR